MLKGLESAIAKNPKLAAILSAVFGWASSHFGWISKLGDLADQTK